MSTESLFNDIREEVRRLVPSSLDITSIEFEGPTVVIYTKDFDKFAENSNITKTLANGLKKRVDIRPDPASLKDSDEVEAKIREMVPDVDIAGFYFDFDTGVVTVEADNPGAITGKGGQMLNDIRKETGWNIQPVRAPPIRSKTISDVRGYMRYSREERQAILKRVAKRIARPMRENYEPFVRVTALGGFRQVGRSASLLMTRDSKILIDCGVDPTNDSSPYFNAPELMPLTDIDAVVITHAHMDHCGLLPVLFKFGYDGPVYCTAPTRDIMALMQLDFIKLANAENRKQPYDSGDVRKEILHVIPLQYEKTTDIAPDVRLTLYNAGHILGSSMAHFNVGNGFHNVVFSGDTKYEKTWLFNPANTRFIRLESLILESTYGGRNDMQASRTDASKELHDLLQRATENGGKVLIPVFAVGRSQEVMLVIEEMMRNGRLPKMNVYLDGMIWEATAIHTAYPEFLNTSLKTQIFQQNENPFLSPIFKRVDSASMREDICHTRDPCIVLATSGMMTGGPVMEYFKEWVDSPENWLLFVGYQSEGSMGRRVQRGLEEVTVRDKGREITLPVRMNVETVDGFSGHSDRKQLMRFISSLEPRPSKILIGHGEERKCTDLASSIYQKYRIDTKAPMNLETIRLR
ncbi:MAG: beta-CASP ribonuclease aCPSF1 [Candidatus Methanomethylophilaceae archaeon]|nr:beta-CASP ribonuclease aCPSF1 [Candidatus Methanomethylophilaceae archaeon]